MKIVSVTVITLFALQRAAGLCLYGTDQANPGKSCAEILKVNPGCFGMSASYWVQCGNMSNAVSVHCDMERLGGGWMRIAKHDFVAGDSCQCEWQNHTAPNGVDYCTTTDGIGSASWTVDNICPFAEINGYVLADHLGFCDGFFGKASNKLDDNYVDGVSITVNTTSFKRQHIFTYAVGREENDINESCDCHGSPYNDYPEFIEWDYLCDSGYFFNTSSATNVSNRTLWTGQGCGTHCCHSVGAPWFYKSLPDVLEMDVELRILTDDSHADEMLLVREFQLYVR